MLRSTASFTSVSTQPTVSTQPSLGGVIESRLFSVQGLAPMGILSYYDGSRVVLHTLPARISHVTPIYGVSYYGEDVLLGVGGNVECWYGGIIFLDL